MEQQQGFGHPAMSTEGATTVQPERGLQPGDPNLVGAAPKEEKKGIVGRVKGLLGGHGRKKEKRDADGKGGLMDKMKAKVRHGHDDDNGEHKRGPARLLSMSSSSSMSTSDEEDIPTVGQAMDPTGPAIAGVNLGRKDFFSAPDGPGADEYSTPNLDPKFHHTGNKKEHSSPDDYGNWPEETNPNHTADEDAYGEGHQLHPTGSDNPNQFGSGYGEGHRSRSTETDNQERTGSGYGGSHPTETGNPNQDVSGYGEPHPTNPTGATNAQGGAVLGDHHGNLNESPRDDNVKEEGLVSKMMGMFKGEPAANTTSTATH